MKKIIVLLLLLVFPVTAFAKEAPIVTKLELANEKGTIKYNGEVQDPTVSGDPSYAVMCKLYNSKDEEIDLLSSAVDNHKFEGTFTVTENGTYTVYCANYDGGEIKSETIKIADISNPKTGDISDVYCFVLGVSVAAFVIALMYPRFLKKNRKSTAPAAKKTTTKKATTKKKTSKK